MPDADSILAMVAYFVIIVAVVVFSALFGENESDDRCGL